MSYNSNILIFSGSNSTVKIVENRDTLEERIRRVKPCLSYGARWID